MMIKHFHIKLCSFLLFTFNIYSQNNVQLANEYFKEYKKLKEEQIINKNLLLESYNLSTQEKLDTLRLYCSIELSKFYHSNASNIDSIFFYAKVNKTLFSDISMPNEEILNNNLLGVSYRQLQKTDSALYYFNLSDIILKKRGNEIKEEIKEEIKITFYIQKFYFLFDVARYKEALELIDIIASYAEKTKLKKDYIMVERLYAKVYREAKIRDEEIKHLKKTIDISDSSVGSMLIYFLIADAYTEIENPDSAVVYFNKTIELALHNNSDYVNWGYMGLAIIYNKTNQIKAKKYFNLMDKDKTKRDLPCDYLFLKAKFENDTIEKVNLCEMAIECNPRMGLKEEIYLYLYNLVRYKNDQKALVYYERAVFFKDTIALVEKRSRIEKAILYKELEQRDEVYKKRSKLNSLVSVLILCLILICLFLVLFFSRKKSIKNKEILIKQKERLVDENKLVNNELKEALLIIDNNFSFFKESKKELKNIAKESAENEDIKIFSDKINHYIINFNRDKKINEKLKEIKNDFFDKVKERSDLTKSEKKIVLLLRLDMSSKEISTYLNITEKSVEQYRYRIRKKLNISKNIHLSDFLKSL